MWNVNSFDFQDCQHNTEGDECDRCAAGYYGNATIGSPYDCQPSDSLVTCSQCDVRGYESCDNGICHCKVRKNLEKLYLKQLILIEYKIQPNVIGSRCNECRPGTYNLSMTNPLGCTECYCSGITNTCEPSRLYRDQMPMNLFADAFILVNRDNHQLIEEELNRDIAINAISHIISDSQEYYWSLPNRFLGNQLLSYGGKLSFKIESQGNELIYSHSEVIISGNGVRLVTERTNHEDNGVCSCLFVMYKYRILLISI